VCSGPVSPGGCHARFVCRVAHHPSAICTHKDALKLKPVAALAYMSFTYSF